MNKKAEYCKAWRAANPEKVLSYRKKYDKAQAPINRAYYRKKKEEAILAYGGKCECCGEGRYEFLTFDHKHNNGGAHRKEIKHAPIHFWAAQNGFPDTLRLLCFNCNCAKAFHGICPHDLEMAGG